MIKKYLVLLSCVFAALLSNAQQDANLTHYSFNNLYFNPAFAGMEQAPVFRLIYRNQWLGYQNSFDDPGAGNTTFLTGDMPILPVEGGAGLTIVNDVQPSFSYRFINLAFSKHVKIKKGKLGIGVGGTYGAMTPRVEWRPPETLNDPTLPEQGVNDFLGDMNAGVFYHSDKKVNSPNSFYVGLSMNRLLESDFQTSNLAAIKDGGSKRHMYLSGGYNLEATYDLIITPMILYKTDFGKTELFETTKRTHSFDIGAKAEYQGAYWGGLNFRQGEAISLLLGGSFMDRKQLKVGYALDLVAIGTAAKALTSHEIMVAYYLPEMVKIPKPIIRTPRYKF